MIKVLKIEITEFRGIRNLRIDFAGENFAVCGRNGTGKSGIVDALEFGLTGNISRLSGRGTGDVSLRDHAPHVDSRNRPDKARVRLTLQVPNFDAAVTVERSVKNPANPVITPDQPAIRDILRQIELHPEFALSRRELIRYVLSTPGDRANEVQALLQLNAVEAVRTALQRIANACQREINPTKRAKELTHGQLLTALRITEWSTTKVLAAVNAQRKVLGLPPLAAISATTSLRDGLAATGASSPAKLPKAQATADLREIKTILGRLGAADIQQSHAQTLGILTDLASDPNALDSINRERFLKSALDYIEGEACPVCDTAWDPDQLKALLGQKLKHFEEIANKRDKAAQRAGPLVSLLAEIGEGVRGIERYGALLTPKIATQALGSFRASLRDNIAAIESLDSIPVAITALEKFSTVPQEVLDTIGEIETAVAAIPDPTEQDAARDYLTEGQVRLQAYREAALAEKRAEERASLSRKVYETYGRVSTAVLNGIYKTVEGQFSELYRYINREDEERFSAHLTPSLGKLGFDVDFYGRGFFPPGAYHSEGHQDAMGICLYLALMRHLLGDAFSFAVLDDVLMSVDAGHRREVCRLLKEKFPHTQFILTTHDEIWLRHMKSAGLIGPRAYIHFRTWDVDHGPTEWEDRDIWQEIDDEIARSNVRGSAGLLRNYLEFVFAEICHFLRAPVEFRGDAQFQLGDLLPPAVGRFGSLLKEGKSAAQSWGKSAEFDAIQIREDEFRARLAATKAEEWQLNPAIHYNEWANFTPVDFAPVVRAYRELLESFSCAEAECASLLYVQPERGTREEVRCVCGSTHINLRKK